MRAMLASVVVAIIGTGVGAAHGSEASAAKAREAIARCEDVDQLPASQKQRKLERLERSAALAEAAVKADAEDARAHLALFCSLAKELALSGLSWRSLGLLRRVQKAIDRALELAPADPDVLVAKGELLRRTPLPLGGDKDLGERLLRRALEIKPDHVVGHLYLARAIAERGAPEARARAYEALALAQKAGTQRERDEAQELLASLEQ